MRTGISSTAGRPSACFEERPVSHGHLTAHEAVASERPICRRARIYAYPRVHARPGDARVSVWVTRARGHEHPSIEALLETAWIRDGRAVAPLHRPGAGAGVLPAGDRADGGRGRHAAAGGLECDRCLHESAWMATTADRDRWLTG